MTAIYNILRCKRIKWSVNVTKIPEQVYGFKFCSLIDRSYHVHIQKSLNKNRISIKSVNEIVVECSWFYDLISCQEELFHLTLHSSF